MLSACIETVNPSQKCEEDKDYDLFRDRLWHREVQQAGEDEEEVVSHPPLQSSFS